LSELFLSGTEPTEKAPDPIPDAGALGDP
jgi:hypothetical protein